MATTAVDAPAATAEDAVALVLQFARVGHAAGYPTADLEDRMLALAQALGLPGAQVSATPTLVDLSVGTLRRQRTYTLRVAPSTVDLAAIARLDDVVQDVLDGRLDEAAARAALDEVAAGRGERPWAVRLAAYPVAGAALTPVLGGDWRDAAGAALVSVVVGAIAIPTVRSARMQQVAAPLAALAASFCAGVLVRAGLAGSPDLITLASLLTLLPGMTLTIGMRELATQHLQSGVANTANALVQLLGLVVGVGIGRSVAEKWFGAAQVSPPQLAFGGLHLVAAVAVGLAFTVSLRAQTRDAPAMCGSTVLALAAHDVGSHLFGRQAGVFVAALAVGLAGSLAGGLLRRSALVFIVPGVLMLVPGSSGFSSALQLLANQTVSGMTTAFDTLVTAILIAYGLMVAMVVLPQRFTQVSPRE